MIDDTISRKAATHFVCNVYRAIGLTDNQMMALCEGIEALPFAQSEREKGRWIPMFNGTYYKCSKCGYVRMKGDDNFCKECGADMRGDNDG